MSGDALLSLSDVSKHYRVRLPGARRASGELRAVDGVSLEIQPSETFALVGESGSGKSTLGRVALRLTDPTAGTVRFEGRDMTSLHGAALRAVRPRMQAVFQDPLGSLNPRMTAGAIVAEPLSAIRGLRGSELDDRVDELFRAVGLDPSRRAARPRALSGGQRQRVSIARAIALEPRLVLADEAVSALDVSVQAQIANLFAELRERMGLAYLFIAHGLPIVRHVSQRVGVMYLGRIVETGDVDEVFEDPRHPYTRALIAASPVPDPRVARERVVLGGEPPSPLAPPSGCRFRTRCPIATDVCAHEAPPVVRLSPTRSVECHHAA
ncbi:ABC transporter ATP-binding protein [Microbacterium marinilacus]|uniref:Dipeptide ABC transporter ATP-binding protein n=1 Tax=Microbacterium marinilacus TaxID=415209 RepID=A0ABP7BQA4_9MICO|nr:ABC transporter ATP-binding protein [Microbacterium marinilacus]MBY0690245.1 ABC transporter ATP-binding protein [Microbacterium marinilacus]